MLSCLVIGFSFKFFFFFNFFTPDQNKHHCYRPWQYDLQERKNKTEFNYRTSLIIPSLTSFGHASKALELELRIMVSDTPVASGSGERPAKRPKIELPAPAVPAAKEEEEEEEVSVEQ